LVIVVERSIEDNVVTNAKLFGEKLKRLPLRTFANDAKTSWELAQAEMGERLDDKVMPLMSDEPTEREDLWSVGFWRLTLDLINQDTRVNDADSAGVHAA
jgi:hypothetical protein